MFEKVYSLYSAFCTQPAFYSQSAVCILHSVCILPLVRSLQSAFYTDRSNDGFEDAREKGKLRGLNSVKKIFPGLKRDKADDKSNNEKNLKHSSSYGVVEGINSLNRLTGRFFTKEVQLIVTPRKAHSGTKNDFETLLGIIPGRDKAGKLSQTDSYSGSRLYIKGFVPDGPALRSGDLRIGMHA